jgi:uncharacterized protein
MLSDIEQRRPKLRQLCREHGIKRLAVFGSAARGAATAASDIDLLVEFEDVESPGYADRYLNFAEAAESTLQRPVDVLTTKSLRNPFLKKRIEQEAVEIHAS